jgi:hypothetical protein
MVVEQILPLFGAEVLLQSYLIEFDLAFRSLSKCWPGELPPDRVWEIFVERIALNLDVTIATFGLFSGFALHFLGASEGGDPWRSIADFRNRHGVPEQIWELFEIASATAADDRTEPPSTERADELRGFIFGFPRAIAVSDLPSHEFEYKGMASPAPERVSYRFQPPDIRPALRKELTTGLRPP